VDATTEKLHHQAIRKGYILRKRLSPARTVD